jgi:SPW repeat-containing protein
MQLLSTRTHTIIGLVVGVVLLVAPWLLGFADEGGAAMMVPICVGIFILLSELTTTSPVSPLKLVPMRIHIIMDVLTGVFLLASPWLFGFSDLELNAWLPHVIVGVLVAGYALVTRTADEVAPVV